MSFNFLWPGSKFSPFLKIKSTHLLASSETKNKTKNIKFYNVTFLNESSTRGHFLFSYKFLAFLFSIFFLKQFFIDNRGLVFPAFGFKTPFCNIVSQMWKTEIEPGSNLSYEIIFQRQSCHSMSPQEITPPPRNWLSLSSSWIFRSQVLISKSAKVVGEQDDKILSSLFTSVLLKFVSTFRAKPPFKIVLRWN